MHPPTAIHVHELHHRFLGVLHRIETHARIAFRHVRCPHQKADFVQEAVAISWKWFRRCFETGSDPTNFVSSIATYAAAAVRTGRKLMGCETARDVMSFVAQRRHRFNLSTTPDYRTLNGNVFDDALSENTETPVPDQVSFRLDFPRWLESLPRTKRDLVSDMMIGERTSELARRHGVSPGRVSQVREEARDSWRTFNNETDSVS